MAKSTKKRKPKKPETIQFHFIKSSFFRVIHCDGAFGGLTGQGAIHVSFYSERKPLPTMVVHEIEPSGKLGQELLVQREGRSGLVREVEVGVVLDLERAKAIHDWLGQRITQLQEVLNASSEDQNK